jgi:excisionase family DNA binding protein
MGVRERLMAIAELLPARARVSFSRADLDELTSNGPAMKKPSYSNLDYTVAEVAQRHGRSPQTVRDWIKSGELQAYRFKDREWRITPAALAEFEGRQRNGQARERSASPGTDLSAWRDVRAG